MPGGAKLSQTKITWYNVIANKGDYISKLKLALVAIVLLIPNVAMEGVKIKDEQKVTEAIYSVLEVKEEVKEFPKPSTEVPKEEAKPVLVVAKPVYKAGIEQWRGLCSKYFPEQVNNCLAIMNAESGGNPNAISSTQDYGLMQIHAPIWCGFFGVTSEQLQEPETNVRLARVIYDRAGSWRPWSTARKLGL